MNALIARILSAKRKRLFGSKPIFEPYRPAPAASLSDVEHHLNCALPESLRTWLLKAGYGDFNEELALRQEWFNAVDRGQLQGHILFAQDIFGNFYSFSPTDGGIHYICRSAPEYAFMAKDFCAFLEELERRSFKLGEWADSLTVSAYDWGV